MTDAAQRVEGRRSLIEEARTRLPEDDEAEAQARLTDAEAHLRLFQGAVDTARADLLPDRFRARSSCSPRTRRTSGCIATGRQTPDVASSSGRRS